AHTPHLRGTCSLRRAHDSLRRRHGRDTTRTAGGRRTRDWRRLADASRRSLGPNRPRSRPSGEPRSNPPARPDRPGARRTGRRARGGGWARGAHLQSGPRHPALDTARACPGPRSTRSPAVRTMSTGVLLMAHGTPASLDDMPEYLRLVRGGRPPSAELVAEMRHNYEAIGGCSPLTRLTMAQAEALQSRLGPGVPVAVGMRNWKPFIKDALVQLAAVGVSRVIGIPMTPQFSTL